MTVLVVTEDYLEWKELYTIKEYPYLCLLQETILNYDIVNKKNINKHKELKL